MATMTDPFAAIGGGVRVGDGWVPKDHPLAKQASGASPSGAPQTPTTGPVPPGGSPSNTAPQNVGQQAQNASTYSQAPGAAPADNTTNQGTQDVVRNSYLQQATQGTQVDTTDPNFVQQSAPFAAAVERQKRDYLADQAEASGPYATGALRGQSRMASERAGISIGQFQADLVARELENRRREIQNALQNLSGLVDADQQRALQRELADLNAELTRLGISTNADVARGDQALRERLAQLQNAFNYAQLSQADRHFGDRLGFDVGLNEALLNQRATEALL